MVSYTNNKKLNKPANGEYPDTWDQPINQDWDIIDKALGSAVQYSIGGSDITMTIEEAQNLRIVLTGSPVPSRSIYIPFKYLSAVEAVGGMWIVDNQTNAAQYILTEVSGSVGVFISSGRRAIIYSDGTNVYFANDERLIAGNGILVSGSTIALSAPVSVVNGGTGWSSLTTNGVLLGNGTGQIKSVPPSTAGYVLTTDGSTWYAAPSAGGGGGGGGGITSLTFATASGMGLNFTPNSLSTPGGTTTLSGTLSIANGGTGTAVIGSGIVSSNGAVLSGGYQVDLAAADVKNILPVSKGGTNASSFVPGLVKYVSATNNLVGGQSVDLSTSDATGLLPIGKGGTGVTSITAGFVKSLGTSLSSQAKIDLTTDVTGTLPVGSGGTGIASATANAVLLGNGTGAFKTVAPGTPNYVLTTDGVTWYAAAPSGSGGLSSISFATAAGMGLTFTPNTINSSGQTTTLSGTLSVANGGTGVSSYAVNGALFSTTGSSISSGTLPINAGGTGSATYAAGYVKSPGGTTAFTTSSGIPGSDINSGVVSTQYGGTGANLISATAGFVKLSAGVMSTATKVAAATEVSGILPVANGGTNISLPNANGALYVNAGGTGYLTGILPVLSGGTNIANPTANGAMYVNGSGTGYLTGTLPVTAGGTNITAPTANGAFYVNGTGNAYLTGTLPVASGGTGLTATQINAANKAIYSTASGTLTADILPVLAGGTGVTTSTGTGSNVLSAGPTFTGTANFASIYGTGTLRVGTASALSTAETVSVSAPSSTDGVVAKVATNSNFTYVGQNSSGTETFTVTGDGGIASKGISSGNIVFKTGSNNRFSNDSNWAAEFRTEIYPSTIYVENPSTTGNFIGWYYNNGAGSIANIANIVCNGTSVSYNTASDYRLKNSVENYSDGLNKINALRPVTFFWNATPDKPRSTGFIAHEVQAIIPEAVNGEKDAVDEDGNIKPQGIDNSFIVPHLVAAIKELTARVEALEAKVGPL